MGAEPLGDLKKSGEARKEIAFSSFVYNGPFSSNDSGTLRISAGNLDLPEFFNNNPEIVSDLSEDEAAAAADLPGGDTVHIPLFRPGYTIYGHWLIDIIPHIVAFKDRYPDAPLHFLTLEESPQWVFSLLSHFFPEAASTVRVKRKQPFKGSLFLSSPARFHDFLSVRSIDLTKSATLLPPGEAPAARRRIFVSRSHHTSGRTLINRSEMELLMQQLQFETVHPERLSFAEQVALFRAAEVIVGEGGSGLHNNIFAPADARIFVIQSAGQPHLIQSGLCRHSGQDVTYVWAKPETPNWFAPFEVDLNILRDALGDFVDDTQQNQQSTQTWSKDMTLLYTPEKPGFGPIHYIELMRNISHHCNPKLYLEVGTQTGVSASAFSCATVCVDPQFGISSDVIGKKPSLQLFQTTSDRFFAKPNLRQILGGTPDVCFLDGMHRYEYLVRDFINAEKLCHKQSVILIHDCYPLNERMALRNHIIGDESEDPATRHGWTGDVWKLLPILKKYRPDLNVVVFDAPPSGLVAVSNLNTSSTVLEDNYIDIVHEFRTLDMNTFGLDNMWSLFPFVATQQLLKKPDELTTFFAYG